ncbi:MAG: hypothetical protein KGZ96_03850 [Clostridia bacterium]|nr:hypothetical protein [Clostridia bacterium]
MLPYFLLFIGIGLTWYAIVNLKKDYKQEQQLMNLVNEAKLVQKNLIRLLNETKDITDLLVEKAEKAGKIIQNNSKHPEKQQPAAEKAVINERKSGLSDNINEKTDSVKSRNVQIKQMLNQGESVEEIAKSMSIGKGEVQLILNLLEKEVANQKWGF